MSMIAICPLGGCAALLLIAAAPSDRRCADPEVPNYQLGNGEVVAPAFDSSRRFGRFIQSTV
jgi:hypothetical protein